MRKVLTSLLLWIIVSSHTVKGQSECLRTNRRPSRMCVARCDPSTGCSGSGQECVCDGDCGYSCVRKGLTCGKPPNVRNAKAQYPSTNFGETVTYVCNKGYTLSGASQRTCRANEKWDGVGPNCLRLCTLPRIPLSTYIKTPVNFNRTYMTGERITLACKKGFKEQLGGNPVRICINGLWTRSPFKCEAIETSACGVSLADFKSRIINGQVSQRGWWPWQIAIYKVANFHCGGALISRRWVLTAAHCFYHGRYYMNNTDLYQIKAGDHNLSVNETSQQEISPETIFVHPRFKPRGFPYYDGDIALVKLSQGVELGEFVRTVCLPEKRDGDLAIPNKRGTVAGWGVTRPLRLGERGSLDDVSKVLRHATFTIRSDQLCLNRSGIQFNSTTAFCAGDGINERDTCHGDSGGAFVREISNSKWVVVGVVSWGNGCAQKDQYGYYARVYPFLDWIKETMETEDGIRYQNCTRTNHQPNVCSEPCDPAQNDCKDNRDCVCDGNCGYSCVKRGSTCVRPTLSRGATIIHPPKQEKYEEGSLVLFGCEQGFYLVGKPVIKCLGSSWTQRQFRCVGFCPDLRQLMNGRVIDTSPSIDQTSVEFRCNENFRLVGRPRLECIDGRWNGNLPFCETTLCLKPTIPSNSYIIYPPTNQVNYTHGTHVFLACQDGYYLKGSPIMACNQTVWFKRQFSCIASCPVIASIKNGIITRTTLREGGEVEIKCRTHFTLVGPSKLKCIEGKWNDSLPSCKAPCPDPGVPGNGSKSGDDFRHTKSVSFTCKEKYELEGEATITCSNGDWTSKAPICKVISCKDPGSPVHGRQSKVSKNFAVGGFVRFKCDKDYTLVGKSKLTCLKSKNWNEATPTCMASCPDPGHPENGKTIGNVFDHDSVVEFECLGDRLLQGSSRAKCNNGQWDQVLPTCRDCGTGLPLGMESGKIPDTSIKASSQKGQHSAHLGRLGGDNYWCSEEEKAGFIQINLQKKYKITGARIQLKTEYKIKSIMVLGQMLKEWVIFHYEQPPYSKEVEQIEARHPFIAQSVRIRVLRAIKESICLRVEVDGCGIPKGCIMRGSAVLIKQNGEYQRGYVGEYILPRYNHFEVYLPGRAHSIIVTRAEVILNEKPNIHELAIGKLVLGEDVASPGLIREGKIEQIIDSVCTIKTNDKTWKSDLNDIRIVKISGFCSR